MIKSILKILALLMVITTMFSIKVFADSVSDDYNNYAFPMSTYKKPVIQSFSLSTSGQTESINPANGGLEIRQADLSLKGRNDFDFNLTRRYNISDSKLNEPHCVVTEQRWTFAVQGYYINGTETKLKYINGELSSVTNRNVSFCKGTQGGLPFTEIPPGLLESRDNCSYWQYSQEAQTVADELNSGDYNTSETYIVGDDLVLETTIYNNGNFLVNVRYWYTDFGAGIPIPEAPYWDTTISNTIDSYTNIGVGWSFELPYIEKRGTLDYYMHLGDKGTFHIIFDEVQWAINASQMMPGYDYEISIGFHNYNFKDLELYYLIYKNTQPYNNSEMNASFKLVEKDGKISYFGFDGRLLGMFDRFGNEIRFLHDTSINGKPLVTQIIDTVGRKINFTYQTDRVTVEVVDDLNAENNRRIYYNKVSAGSGKYLLDNVVDAENRTTSYVYEQKPFKFSFRKKDPYTDGNHPVGISNYVCLKRIIYPTGGKTEYDYNEVTYSNQNLGGNGFIQFYKISDRADYGKDGAMYNYKSYEYHNYFNGDEKREYDGYPSYWLNGIPDGFEVKTDILDNSGNKELYINKYIKNSSTNVNDLLLTNILMEGPEHKYETINTYNSTSKLLVKTINRVYNKATGNYLDMIQNYQYDPGNYKDLIGYWDIQAEGNTGNTQHKTTYTYNNSYHYITSKTYKKDEDTSITEEYVPYQDDQKKIEWYRIRENGVLKSQTRYLYDSYGNIIEEQKYKDDWVNYISVKSSYDDNDAARNGKFNGLYITRKWVEDVRDADHNLITARPGITSGIIDECYTYDWFGNIIIKQNGIGNQTIFNYDKLNRITKQVNADLSFKTYEYITNSTDNYTISKDENYNSSEYNGYGYQGKSVFDEFGNLIYDQIWAKNASGNYEFITLNQYEYDEEFKLDREKNMINGRLIDYSYYSDGRINTTQVLDTNNESELLYQESYIYNDCDDTCSLSKVTKTVTGEPNAPDVITSTYMNKAGFVEKQGSVHDGVEYLDTFKYDYLGNKIEEKAARAYAESWSQPWTAKYEYNYAGQSTKVYNINGDYSTTEYDALGRVKSVTDIEGNKASSIYSTSYTYDNMGRLIEESIPFEDVNETVVYSVKKHYYDRNGNIIKEKVQSNKFSEAESFNQTEYEYNSRNMLTMVTTYDGEISENYTQYYYDAVGNKLRMYTALNDPLEILGLDNEVEGSDPDYSTTKYEYDPFKRMVKMIDPLGMEEDYQYDLNGSLVQKIDRNRSIIMHTYDGLNRLLSRSVANSDDPSLNASYSYTYTLTGNRASMNGGGINTTYTYDDLGRLDTETESNGIVKEYMYDAANNRKSLVIKKDGAVKTSTTYAYDNMNRLHEVYEGGQLTATYEYDDNGNRESLAYSNGNLIQYQYNLANKLTTQANKKGANLLSQYMYSYFLDGNQSEKNETVTGKVTNYQYDGLGRLESEIEKENEVVTNSISYTYDDYNNRETMTTIDGITTTYDYDDNNRLVTETKVTGEIIETTRYSHDNNGNQIYKALEILEPAEVGEVEIFTVSISGEGGDESVTFNEYDGFNQLKKVTTGNMTSTYSYNGDGLRRSKTVNGVATVHVWDGDQIAVELDGAGVVTNKYVRGINLLYAEDDTGVNRKWYLFNGHGDVVQLTGNDGNVTKSYDYDAFGNEKNPDPTDTNVFRYCGEYFDKETGTIYLRARYYDPQIGRFISADTNWGKDSDPLSLNLYTYCYNNPMRYTDSSGNIPVETVIDIASIGWSATDFINNPSWANAGFLAWDVVATLLPYVPGSYTAKGVKLLGKADDVADVARALSKADNIIDGANAFRKNKSSIIMGYKELKNTVKSLKIKGLEVHHLFEKRFAEKLGLNANEILSVALDKDTHKQITKLMREEIPYNSLFAKGRTTSSASVQEIWDATRKVYNELGLTQYLDLLKQQLIDGGTAKKITNWGTW